MRDGRVAWLLAAGLATALTACTSQQQVTRSTWDGMGDAAGWQVSVRGGATGDGRTPTAQPLPRAMGGSGQEWDLTTHVDPHRGPDDKIYSLQIGYYDEQFGPDFRKAAEQAVAVLRQEGVQAFYYHGPNRSLVTLELFTDADFAQQPTESGAIRVYGPRMRKLQETFPHASANGRTLMQKLDTGTSHPVPSFIVEVR